MQLHQNTFKDKHLQWAQLKTNTMCLFCLCWKSKYVLNCRHIMYNIYVWIFRQVLPNLKYHYYISNCILCLFRMLIVQLKLFIAEYQILFIDEENTQDIVSLEFMSLIQDLICDCSLQDLFDKVWGTSSDKYF